MIGKTLLLLALPVGAVCAQSSPVHVLVTSPNGAEFRIVRTTRDAAERPIFARGRLELAVAEAPEAGAIQTTEIVGLDTVNNLHVEATQGGRVIASGDGRYLTVRRQETGIVIEARSAAPLSVRNEIRKPD